MADLKDKIEKLSFQAQTTPLVATCDTRLLFEVLNEAEEQEKILDILKRIIKVKKSDVYGFVLVVRGTDEEENTIKEWLDND